MRQTQISHSAPSIMNSVLPQLSRSTRSLTRDTEGDWDETKGNGHINYTHSLGGSYHRRLTEGPTERQRDRERQRNGDDDAHVVKYVSPVRGSVCPQQQDACRLLSYVTVLLMGAPIAQAHTDVRAVVSVHTRWMAASVHVGGGGREGECFCDISVCTVA